MPEGDAAAKATRFGERLPGATELLGDVEHLDRAAELASEGARGPAEPPPLGPHILFGDDFGAMLHNQVLNLSEGRISVVQALFERA